MIFYIKSSPARNGMFHKKQGKSDGWVVIPLCKEAQNLFNNEFKKQRTVLNNVEFDRHIKIVCKLPGIYSLIEFCYKRGHKDVKVLSQNLPASLHIVADVLFAPMSF